MEEQGGDGDGCFKGGRNKGGGGGRGGGGKWGEGGHLVLDTRFQLAQAGHGLLLHVGVQVGAEDP